MFRRALAVMPTLARGMSTEARPMTRVVQYPFDKTKMAEVTEWAKESGMAEKLRGRNR